MAIAFDSATTVSTANAATVTFSHTCSGSNRILWVYSCAASPGASGATYNGVAMTEAVSFTTAQSNTGKLFYLIAPDTGTNDVVLTKAASSGQFAGLSWSFTGASQTGVPDATSTDETGASTSFSQSVTSVADNCFAVWGIQAKSGASLTGGSNTTVSSQPELVLHGTSGAYSTAAKTPAGTFTLNVTSTSQAWAGVMASFSPAAEADTFTPKVMMF